MRSESGPGLRAGLRARAGHRLSAKPGLCGSATRLGGRQVPTTSVLTYLGGCEVRRPLGTRRVGGGELLLVRLDARLQPYVMDAATACEAGCNRTRGRLQPYAMEAATVCEAGCNRM